MDEMKLKSAGVDYDMALERFVGNRMLYEKFLKKFVTDEHVENVKKAYLKKDYNEMFEQAHALKGVAGTLGMNSLYQASTELVDVLRAGIYDDIEDMLKRLEAESEKMLQLLQDE